MWALKCLPPSLVLLPESSICNCLPPGLASVFVFEMTNKGNLFFFVNLFPGNNKEWQRSALCCFVMATYSSIFAWKTPWTEEAGRLQSMGSQRVGHD